jgi:CubicO group peptidase (beta-lactamase class C family)
MTPTSIPKALAVVEQSKVEGLHIGAQGFVSLRGEVVADFAVGEARQGVAMTTDTVMLWLSCSKPLAAVALGQLWEQGKLQPDDPVAVHIPEFEANGKEAVTLRHLLTHTGGLPSIPTGWPSASWDESITRVCTCELEPDWPPGRRAAYNVQVSWFVLAEVVRRVDGRPYPQYVREEIFEPLDMIDSWVELPPDRHEAYGDRLGVMHITERGEVKPHPFAYDAPRSTAACNPGGSGRGPLRELGRFHEMILGRGTRNGVRILSPQTVEALTARHRVGLRDETFQQQMDWGLGFVVDNNQYGADKLRYGYGLHSSPRAVGHSGYQSSTGFCDPEFGLVATIVFNGTPGEMKHGRRMRAYLTALYEDLGLA